MRALLLELADRNIYVSSSLHATHSTEILKEASILFPTYTSGATILVTQPPSEIYRYPLVDPLTFISSVARAAPFEKRGVQFAVKHRPRIERERGSMRTRLQTLRRGGTLNKSKISQVLTGKGRRNESFEGLGDEGKFSASSYASIPVERTPNTNEFPDFCDEYK